MISLKSKLPSITQIIVSSFAFSFVSLALASDCAKPFTIQKYIITVPARVPNTSLDNPTSLYQYLKAAPPLDAIDLLTMLVTKEMGVNQQGQPLSKKEMLSRVERLQGLRNALTGVSSHPATPGDHLTYVSIDLDRLFGPSATTFLAVPPPGFIAIQKSGILTAHLRIKNRGSRGTTPTLQIDLKGMDAVDPLSSRPVDDGIGTFLEDFKPFKQIEFEGKPLLAIVVDLQKVNIGAKSHKGVLVTLTDRRGEIVGEIKTADEFKRAISTSHVGDLPLSILKAIGETRALFANDLEQLVFLDNIVTLSSLVLELEQRIHQGQSKKNIQEWWFTRYTASQLTFRIKLPGDWAQLFPKAYPTSLQTESRSDEIHLLFDLDEILEGSSFPQMNLYTD